MKMLKIIILSIFSLLVSMSLQAGGGAAASSSSSGGGAGGGGNAATMSVGFKSKLSLRRKKILEIAEERRANNTFGDNDENIIANLQNKIKDEELEILKIEEEINKLAN